MQRKRYAPGRTGSAARTAVVLALGLGLGTGLTGCSAGTPADDIAVDAKAGPAAPVAPPGRYRTLFEPCGAVPQATLKDLLPGAAALPDAERDRAYRGAAAVTYDTDRRVGCSWKADSPDTSHRLTLDIERVVSYDTTVSDADRAQEVYVRKQLAAGIPVPPTAPPTTAPTPSTPPASGQTPGKTPPGTAPTPKDPEATTPPGTTPAAGAAAGSGAPTGTSPAAPGTPGTPGATGLEPRVLDGLGDIAYLDDVLSKVGGSGKQRAVRVVFRTSNVIVTVSYQEQTTGSAEAPDSAELQEKARNLARLLAERLEE
ncbi:MULTISPECIES: hypothetical protein [Streptomyces]|uniref:DUF3558 domain-containing protein n=1 Tax=Streptomyces venezuelae (strain ATCC 10712 / CBS 650.69 / DSM 40230 / JCM 4526 / NBRC 13096 / PD 04745) TaxID=953739 RepID=F2R8Z8_STRVP|nr:hypothetical protein [Streptomyces venezuelae]APE22300.1 hypothetical protein vnz_15590 [Streptomyces venezuelae]QER99682.1 DUF3558 domain-containing protein [Streptomyces venezuelae ATCC 10712]CCA56458.1 hypothetical protein SVEN_3172 [Streptomyces venezuelae ATCC 10712]